MSRLWENYAPDNQYIIPKHVDCSFVEAWCVNQSSGKPREIEVNPLIRFSKIFEALCRLTHGECKGGNVKAVVNMVLHYLALLDQKLGMNRNSFLDRLYFEDITAGRYGEKCKNFFEAIPYEKKRIIARNLRHYHQENERKSRFEECIMEIFPAARLYIYTPENKYLIYLPYEENDENTTLINLMVLLFLEVTLHWEAFWQKHFGIIGRDQTMHLDQVVIY